MDIADSKPFSSAKVEVKKRSRQKVAWPAFELAFLDHDFLLHKSLRSVRLQLELLKPELSQQKLKIESTIVVFGSARVVDPEVTKQELKQVQKKLKHTPNSTSAKKAEKLLKNQLKKANTTKNRNVSVKLSRSAVKKIDVVISSLSRVGALASWKLPTAVHEMSKLKVSV